MFFLMRMRRICTGWQDVLLPPFAVVIFISIFSSSATSPEAVIRFFRMHLNGDGSLSPVAVSWLRRRRAVSFRCLDEEASPSLPLSIC